MTSLGIVIPCYNEQEVLPETCARMIALLDRLASAGKVDRESRVYFVDDGSRDRTWELIESFVGSGAPVVGIKLSRNRGHQNALLAGLLTATGDALISIDADLQDDINVIEEMVDRFHEGSEIVYGVRNRRENDTRFKRLTAESFYRLVAAMGAQTIFNHADYRLMSRRAIDGLKQFREVNLFLRGVVPLIGYASSVVYYDRSARFAGTSKYPLRKMIGLALDAITSFSVVPLRIITFIGFAVFLLSLVMAGWILWVKFYDGQAVPGWASTVLPLVFLGGVQILCLGVMGEYLGKLYSESKARPRFIIEKIAQPQDRPGRQKPSSATFGVTAMPNDIRSPA